MNYAVVTTKVDPKTKQAAQDVAESLGIPLSVMVKAFLKHVIKTRSVTFSDRGDEYPNTYLRSTIAQARKDWDEGKAIEWNPNNL